MAKAPPKSKLTTRALMAAAITGLVFWAIFRKVKWAGVGAVMQGMEPFWFLLAVAAYGAGLFLNAMRWHVALALEDLTVDLGTTLKAILVGHFFNVLFFGVVGGDAAKTALYSRWHKSSAARVLAACVVDRMFGMGGAVVFYSCVVLGFLVGDAEWLGNQSWELKAPSAIAPVLVLAAVVVGWLAWKQPFRGNAFLRDTLGSMRRNLAALKAAPARAAGGLGLGICWHLVLSGSMALALRSVATVDVPWWQLLWTFPTISLLTSVPVTFGGTGVREAIAIMLWGLYNVPAADALAAGLLTSLSYFLWAGAGALVTWREEARVKLAQAGPAV